MLRPLPDRFTFRTSEFTGRGIRVSLEFRRHRLGCIGMGLDIGGLGKRGLGVAQQVLKLTLLFGGKGGRSGSGEACEGAAEEGCTGREHGCGRQMGGSQGGLR